MDCRLDGAMVSLFAAHSSAIHPVKADDHPDRAKVYPMVLPSERKIFFLTVVELCLLEGECRVSVTLITN